jgi:hypothetical protein
MERFRLSAGAVPLCNISLNLLLFFVDFMPLWDVVTGIFPTKTQRTQRVFLKFEYSFTC